MAGASTREEKAKEPKAFLRWIGGKRLLVHRLIEFLPTDVRTRKYHEPFAGAASLFFSISPQEAVLSDLNRHLIESYRHVQANPYRVSQYLREHKRRDNESYYYTIRDLYNRSGFGPAQAARFIYLNHACFNGIFRVNRQGAFNVPYGNKRNAQIPSTSHLLQVSTVLNHAELRVASFEDSLNVVTAGDFVYLDPPYPPLNGTSFFTHYTADRFSEDDQRRVADSVKNLDRKGAFFLLTNADLPYIRKL